MSHPSIYLSTTKKRFTSLYDTKVAVLFLAECNGFWNVNKCRAGLYLVLGLRDLSCRKNMFLEAMFLILIKDYEGTLIKINKNYTI